MRRVLAIACVLCLPLAVGGCLDFADDAPAPIETVVIEGAFATEIGERVSGADVDRAVLPGAAVDVDLDPCNCDNQACIDQWVSKNLGCDVCVVLRCGDQRSHVCTHCDPTPGPAPR